MKSAPIQTTPSESIPSPAIAPTPAVRGERFFCWVDHQLARLDGLFARVIPPEYNPLAQSGQAANFALSLAVVSGIAMLIWYSPSLQQAYPTLAAISEGHTLGGWVRALHRYSSDLVMLLLLVHAGRMLFARKLSGARWLPWVSGVGLIALVWFIGWTGYWLVWDQPAQQIAVGSMRLLDALPVFGEPLGRLYLVDRLVPSLLFFVVFFLHMLLPLGIAMGLVVHLLRVSRVRIFPPRPMLAALTLGLAIAAWVIPAPLDPPAEMAVKATSFTVDAWYMSPLALGLRFQHGGLWVALFGTVALSAALPWILGRRRPSVSYQAVIEQSRCHACTQCLQDCPFDAITMVTRTDGKRFPSQAQVDPTRCVGCGVCAGSCDSEGIVLAWFDTAPEEKRLHAEIAASIQRGGTGWVALIAGDIDGGLGQFSTSVWQKRLPGYQVYGVPTASWVRPSFVEELLKSGVSGVLIVRDARSESAARDGNKWVRDRLDGTRTPQFRPQRASAEGKWRVVDFDPSAVSELARDAAAWQSHGTAIVRRAGRGKSLLAGTLLTIGVGAVTLAPSHLKVSNPAPTTPELIFSFKAFGQMTDAVSPLADQSDVPVHMRGRSTAKPHRADITVRVSIDGVLSERSFSAKGISHDGPAIDAWTHLMTPGPHEIMIELQSGPETEPLRWTGIIDAKIRRMHVLTFDSATGFRLE